MDDEEAIRGDFKDNPDRECSNYFGKKPVKALLKRNKLLSVFRGHQVKQDGFYMHKWGSKDSFPYVITIFSAPNYCGSYKNKAAVLILKNNNLQLKQYQDTEPPYVLPEGLNLFSWSMPFLAEKITGMLYSILKQCSPAELAKMDGNATEAIQGEVKKAEEKQKKKMMLRNKIQTVGRMSKMLSFMRENKEQLLQLKNMSQDGKLPQGILLEQMPLISFPAKSFALSKDLDKENEKRPTAKDK